MTYDSTKDTQQHINQVQTLIAQFQAALDDRLAAHDRSKLQSPEKEMFDEYTPKLRALTYGSAEYKACLDKMGVALKHHYENNTHHPEHYKNGVTDMSLLDVFEMLADWKAATLRHADGDILNSIEINKVRFNLSDQLANILLNTAYEMGWLIAREVEGG